MPKILKFDYNEYVPKEVLRKDIRNRKKGSAIYLPDGRIQGYGIVDFFKNVANAVSENKDIIKNVLDIGNQSASTVGNVSKGVTDFVKSIEDIKAIRMKNQELENSLREKLRKKKDKTGQGFYYV